MKVTIFRIVALLTVLSMLLTACGGAATPAPAPTQAPAAPAPTQAPAATQDVNALISTGMAQTAAAN